MQIPCRSGGRPKVATDMRMHQNALSVLHATLRRCMLENVYAVVPVLSALQKLRFFLFYTDEISVAAGNEAFEALLD